MSINPLIEFHTISYFLEVSVLTKSVRIILELFED